MKAKILDTNGKETSSYELPKEVFELPWNADLVHQVIVSMEEKVREGNAHSKDRSEVRGGGRKPWQQKGTGRARHGSIRSPIWAGGGVTHGPRNERNYENKINKKMRRKALYIILSQKARDGEIILLKKLPDTPKTKEALNILKNLSKYKGFEKILYKKGKRTLIYSPEKNNVALKMFSNIESAHVEEARNANPLDIMRYKYIVLVDPEKSIKALTNTTQIRKEKIKEAK